MQERGMESGSDGTPADGVTEDVTIEELARVCRLTYNQVRRRHTGQVKYAAKAGSRWETCFRKLAELIKRNGYDVTDYLVAQFTCMYPSYPMPNALYSAKAEARYRTWTGTDRTIDDNIRAANDEEPAGRRLELSRRFMSEVKYLTTRVELGVPLHRILSYKGSPLSVLTRYCVALNNGMDALADIFRATAKAQFDTNPKEYREIYGELLDSAFLSTE